MEAAGTVFAGLGEALDRGIELRLQAILAGGDSGHLLASGVFRARADLQRLADDLSAGGLGTPEAADKFADLVDRHGESRGGEDKPAQGLGAVGSGEFGKE
jgi:hypothetical protein